MCLTSLSPDFIQWIALGISKGFIGEEKETPPRKVGRRKIANGIYYNGRYKKWFIKTDTQTFGPYPTERGAKVMMGKLVKKEG